MEYLKSFIDSYLTFHYGLGFAIGLVIFCGYLFWITKCNKSQGQSVSRKEVLCGLALSVYLVFLLGGTVLNREIGDKYLVEWIPFWSYYDLISEWNKSMATQILYNVLVFIPWGILLPALVQVKRKFRFVVLGTVGISLAIEVTQLVFKLGLFEFDDVIHNTLGAVIGYGVWLIFKKRK